MAIGRRIVIAALALLLAGAAPALAAGLTLDGEVQKPQQLTASDLEAMPATSVQVSFVTGHGEESASYTGVLLWTLLANAVTVDGPEKDAQLRHTILVTGSDGYAVALAVGELDPKFEGKAVIVAYAKDGKPLDPADGLRLVVPGDKHGGRAVRDVVHIEVK